MKIGLIVVSYNRPEYLKESLAMLQLHSWGGAKERIVVIDEPFTEEKYGWIGKTYEDSVPGFFCIYQENSGVGAAKNAGLQELLLRGCTDLFVMEDDILMQRSDTCIQYIEYAKKTQVPHLNFAFHGSGNTGKAKYIQWKGQQVVVYPESIGAFSYYTKDILDRVGLIDSNFKNAWEHVEHTWRITKTGLIPKFWYFMDHPVSDLLLKEIPGSIINSSIRPRSDWQSNINKGQAYWEKKHGTFLPAQPDWRA